MTPKEKSKELFDKFDIIISTDDPNWRSECKLCAMVAVEEIRNILSMPNIPKYVPIYTDQYWQEVKQELEKL